MKYIPKYRNTIIARIKERRFFLTLKRTLKTLIIVEVNSNGKLHKATVKKKKSMPKVFCLNQNLEECLAVINDLKLNFDQQKMKYNPNKKKLNKKSIKNIQSMFDFKTIDSISPSAALIWSALYDDRKTVTGQDHFTIDEKHWKPAVVKNLNEIGFFDILDIEPLERKMIINNDFKILRFKSNITAEGDILTLLIDDMIDLLPDYLKNNLKILDPYKALIEAVVNTKMHAYPEGHKFNTNLSKKWWVTGAYDKNNEKVSFAVFDMGITVPTSIMTSKKWKKPDETFWRWVKRYGFNSSVEGKKIEFATRYKISRTNLPNRGKGFADIIKHVQNAKGSLRIISGNGVFMWDNENKYSDYDTKTKLAGTLIEWTISLIDDEVSQ